MLQLITANLIFKILRHLKHGILKFINIREFKRFLKFVKCEISVYYKYILCLLYYRTTVMSLSTVSLSEI